MSRTKSKEMEITKMSQMSIRGLKNMTNKITEIKPRWMGSILEWR